jgi:predicted permease
MWAWLSKARAVFGRATLDEDLRAELDAHLQMEVEANLDRGMTPENASLSARRRLGNPTIIRESSREAWMFRSQETLFQDLRYGLRVLRRSPGFAVTSVSVIALGIGANTASLSLLDAVVLRPLPVKAPQQLVLIDGEYETRWSLISYPMYRDLADRQRVFSDVVASSDYSATPLRVRAGGSSVVRAVRGGAVSGNYFSTLGLVPALGRFFVPADDEPGRAAVAVVSYDFWKRELGGASSVVGQSLTIGELGGRSGDVEEASFRVIGVAPPGFVGISTGSSLEIWVPITKFRSAQELGNRRATFFRLVGRLKPGVAISQAQTAMTLLFQQFRAEELQTRGDSVSGQDVRVEGYRIALEPGDKGFGFFRETLARPLAIVTAMAASLVLIVSMNLTTLLLARATARQREIAIRQSLGASRRRLLQQALTENLLLAMLGGTLGLVFAVWASRILLSFVSAEIALNSGFNQYVPAGLEFQLNQRVLVFTGGAALLIGLFLALVPTLVVKRPDIITLLKQWTGTRRSVSVGQLRIPIGKILAVSQVAFSVVLLVGAGLMVRTVINLRGLDPGFDPANVLLVDLDVRGAGRTGPQLTAFERSLHERLNELPGVRSASLSWISLFSGTDLGVRVMLDGDSSPRGEGARVDVVSAEYFETVGMTLIAGRTFTRRDDEAAPPVAIVNEAFVRRFVQRDNPIGKRFSVGRMLGPAMVKEIVGVVHDAKYNDLRQSAKEMFYVPLLQTPTLPGRSIQVRTVGSPRVLSQQIRQVVREADPNVVITDIKTLSDQVDRTLVRERLLAHLSGFFGAAALLLACIGLYSLLAYQVIQRTQEIGVRIALGSLRASLLWLVLREALLLVGLGLALGVPSALALSHSVASLLFGLAPTDPMTIGVVIMILLGVAGLSCYLPARRAAGVDPIIALRFE